MSVNLPPGVRHYGVSYDDSAGVEFPIRIPYSNYGHICSRMLRYSASNNGVTLKYGLGIIQGH